MSQAPLRVLFHDYGGHAHTARLARALCAHQLDVSYVSFAGFSTPKGMVGAAPDDPDNFKATQLDIGRPFDKDNLLRRLLQQHEYARTLMRFVAAEAPDVVISSNSPLEVQEALLAWCHRHAAGFVFWCQDIHAEAIGRILGKKSPWLGRLAGVYYRAKERRLFRRSDALVVIADDFRAVLNAPPWNVGRTDIEVIENIAPLDEMPPFPRDNDWSLANMRPGRQRIVYTGTLARKHNPDMLLALARSLDVDVWLFSEGSSPDYVAARAQAEGLDNLFVRPWLSVGDLPKALAAGDMLYAVIEADAGVFSVPSKVLAYLAAGRPILASLPPDNLAGKTILKAGAGLVSAPADEPGLIANARRLLGDPTERDRMGRSGRRYAEAAFDVERVAAAFADILRGAVSRGGAASDGEAPLRPALESAMSAGTPRE